MKLETHILEQVLILENEQDFLVLPLEKTIIVPTEKMNFSPVQRTVCISMKTQIQLYFRKSIRRVRV